MRLHLFEFGDQPWFPGALRDAMTAYLAATYKMIPVARPWAEILARSLDRQGTNTIVDLCSGAGGPLPAVEQELRKLSHGEVRIVMTDRFPRSGVLPVDARQVPPDLRGVRTMFAAFHHFRPKEAERILRDARDRRQGICIFEATRRSPLPVAAALLIPLMVLLLTPRIRPLGWIQLLFTYLVPILPLAIAWDGLVSNLRTYTTKELREMTGALRADSYVWELLDLRVEGVLYPLPVVVGGASPRPAE